MSVTYVESSALAKLVVVEVGSGALRGHLRGRSLVTSALTRVEVARAVRRAGVPAVPTLEEVLRTVTVIAIHDEVLRRAGQLDPAALRSLDAIHLATALHLAEDLDNFITYDRQLGRAAVAAGLSVDSPR